MASFTGKDFMANAELLTPAVRMALASAGDGVLGADVFTDLVRGDVVLSVKHLLLTRHELLDHSSETWHRLFRVRLYRAIMAEQPPAGVAVRVERRRMLFRAKEAAQRKPRRK
jgi:hypothetical protein